MRIDADGATGFGACYGPHPLELGLSVLKQLRLYFSPHEGVMYYTIADAHRDSAAVVGAAPKRSAPAGGNPCRTVGRLNSSFIDGRPPTAGVARRPSSSAGAGLMYDVCSIVLDCQKT
jgi:hypothetical protein